MEVITREAAKAAGLKRYYTGIPCAKGHLVERYVSSQGCTQCSREKALVGYHKTKDDKKEQHRDKVRRWRKENPEKRAEQKQRYYERYPEKLAESKRGHKARREATKRGAMMPDRGRGDAAKENSVILRAQLVTELAGREYHTDHIVALSGGREDGTPIFGPHAWWNLRALDGEENIKKSNLVTEANIQKALCNLSSSGVSEDYVTAVEENMRAGIKPCDWSLPVKV